jgi:formiminoglutamase
MDIPSSGTMFRQILEQDLNAGYLCIGVQRLGNTKSLFDAADQLGCEYLMAEKVHLMNMDSVFQKIDDFAKPYDKLIFTLCMDVIEASSAPGVSAPTPLGLDPKNVREILKHIAAHPKSMSFDISEVNPEVDENGKTSRLAAYLVAETLDGFFAKKIKRNY